MLNDILTDEFLKRIIYPRTREDRVLQSVALSAVDYEVYDLDISELKRLSHEDYLFAVSLMRAGHNPEFQDELNIIAQKADEEFGINNTYIVELKPHLHIAQLRRNKKKYTTKSVDLSVFGVERAQKRLRYLRDRLLFELDARGILGGWTPVVGMRIVMGSIERRRKLRTFNFEYSWVPAGEKKPRSIARAMRMYGFVGAYESIKNELVQHGIEIRSEDIRFYAPTADQYERFKRYIPDLPEPFK